MYQAPTHFKPPLKTTPVPDPATALRSTSTSPQTMSETTNAKRWRRGIKWGVVGFPLLLLCASQLGFGFPNFLPLDNLLDFLTELTFPTPFASSSSVANHALFPLRELAVENHIEPRSIYAPPLSYSQEHIPQQVLPPTSPSQKGIGVEETGWMNRRMEENPPPSSGPNMENPTFFPQPQESGFEEPRYGLREEDMSSHSLDNSHIDKGMMSPDPDVPHAYSPHAREGDYLPQVREGESQPDSTLPFALTLDQERGRPIIQPPPVLAREYSFSIVPGFPGILPVLSFAVKQFDRVILYNNDMHAHRLIFILNDQQRQEVLHPRQQQVIEIPDMNQVVRFFVYSMKEPRRVFLDFLPERNLYS